MLLRLVFIAVACAALPACSSSTSPRIGTPAAAPKARTGPQSIPADPTTTPLVIGESFTINSAILSEPRHINVFAPTEYGRKFDGPLPVLYVLDGGMDEDFLHIAGLVQILVS